MGYRFKTRREECLEGLRPSPDPTRKRGNTTRREATDAQRQFVMGSIQFAPHDPRRVDGRPPMVTGPALKALEDIQVAHWKEIEASRERIEGLEQLVTKMSEVLEMFDARLRALEE